MYFWNVKWFTLPQMPSEERSNVTRHSAHGKKQADDLPQRIPDRCSRAHRLFWLQALVKHQVSGPTSWTPELIPCQGQQALKAAACFFFFFFFWIVDPAQGTAEVNQSAKLKATRNTAFYQKTLFFFSFLIQERTRVFMSKGLGQTCCFAETSFIYGRIPWVFPRAVIGETAGLISRITLNYSKVAKFLKNGQIP